MKERKKHIMNIINLILFVVLIIVLILGITREGVGNQENSKSPSELMAPDAGTKK